MTQDNLSFNVVGGPSKFDLMISLFDVNKGPRRTVELQLEGTRTPINIAITMVQQEDGSGESWNIEGRIIDHCASFNIKGYYSSGERRGCITFITPFRHTMKNGKINKVDMADYLDWLRGK